MSKLVLVRWIHLGHNLESYLYFGFTYRQCIGYRRFWIPCFSDHISAPFAAPPCSGVIQVRMISLIKMAFKHYCINRTARVGNSRHSEFIQGPPCNWDRQIRRHNAWPIIRGTTWRCRRRHKPQAFCQAGRAPILSWRCANNSDSRTKFNNFNSPELKARWTYYAKARKQASRSSLLLDRLITILEIPMQTVYRTEQIVSPRSCHLDWDSRRIDKRTDRNPVTKAEASEGPIKTYGAAKKYAELAEWEWAEERPHVEVTTSRPF